MRIFYNIIIYYSIYLYKERFKELLKKAFPHSPEAFGNMGVDFIHTLGVLKVLKATL
jgi:hypothetical protein